MFGKFYSISDVFDTIIRGKTDKNIISSTSKLAEETAYFVMLSEHYSFNNEFYDSCCSCYQETETVVFLIVFGIFATSNYPKN